MSPTVSNREIFSYSMAAWKGYCGEDPTGHGGEITNL